MIPIATDLSKLDCWPLNGYAPGGYLFTCAICKEQSVAAKRATCCLGCAINKIKRISSENAEQAEHFKRVYEAKGPQERIAAAAVFHGSTISLPPPARHHTILHTMLLVMGIDVSKVPMDNQGFLTSQGRFVNRVEGFYIASRAGQLLEPEKFKHAKAAPQLFSEDMW